MTHEPHAIHRTTYTLDQIDETAAMVYQQFARARICALIGTLGAGKTTLVQAILRQAGVEGVIQSPTFAYVETYTGYGDRTWYHFDAYRISDEAQFRAMGFVDLLEDPAAYAIIEWPERLIPLIAPYGAFACDIRYVTDTSRELYIYDIPRP